MATLCSGVSASVRAQRRTLANPRTKARAVAVATLIATFVLAACSGGSNAVDTTAAGQFRFVNATSRGSLIPIASRKPAGALIGTLINGGSWRLDAHRGKVVLINFWASWCAPCVTESPMLDSVYRSVAGQGVDFVGIDVKDERQAAQAFIADKHMTYPMIYDEPARTALELGIPAGGLPVTTLVDRSGRVAAVYLGAVQRADISATLHRLIAERR